MFSFIDAYCVFNTNFIYMDVRVLKSKVKVFFFALKIVENTSSLMILFVNCVYWIIVNRHCAE